MRQVLAIALCALPLLGFSRCARGEEITPANYALATDIHMSDQGGLPPLDTIVRRAKFCGAKWLGILGDTSNRSSYLASNWQILSAFLLRSWGGPFFCVPGNHDVDSADSLAAFRAAVGNDYFTVKDDGCAFVFIDTPLLVAKNLNSPAEYLFSERERQAHWDWLAFELASAASEHRRIFISGHHPIFVNAENEGDDYWNFPWADRTRMLDLCRRYGVQAYFCGHLHRTLDRPGQSPQIYVSGSASYSFDARGTGFRLLQITHSGFHTYWVRTDQMDTEAPTTPTLLTVRGMTGRSATLSWQPSADANGIAFYRVFMNGRLVVERNIGEECTLGGLPASGPCHVSVDAVDPFGNISGAAATALDPIPISAAEGWRRYE